MSEEQPKKEKEQSLGEYLYQQRLTTGASIEQVCKEHHLRPEQIRAIEAGDWKALPGDAYARAFLSSLAREYKIDREMVLNRYAQETGQSRGVESAQLPFDDGSSENGRHSRTAFLIILTLTAIALAIFSTLRPEENTYTPPKKLTPPLVTVPVATEIDSTEEKELHLLDGAEADSVVPAEPEEKSEEKLSLSSATLSKVKIDTTKALPLATPEKAKSSAALSSAALSKVKTDSTKALPLATPEKAKSSAALSSAALSKAKTDSTKALPLSTQEKEKSSKTSSISSASQKKTKSTGIPSQLKISCHKDSAWIEIRTSNDSTWAVWVRESGITYTRTHTDTMYIRTGHGEKLRYELNNRTIAPEGSSFIIYNGQLMRSL